MVLKCRTKTCKELLTNITAAAGNWNKAIITDKRLLSKTKSFTTFQPGGVPTAPAIKKHKYYHCPSKLNKAVRISDPKIPSKTKWFTFYLKIYSSTGRSILISSHYESMGCWSFAQLSNCVTQRSKTNPYPVMSWLKTSSNFTSFQNPREGSLPKTFCSTYCTRPVSYTHLTLPTSSTV